MTEINRLLRKRGLEVVRADKQPSWRSFNELLIEWGLRPNTIFDIGVGTGSPFLYESFPDAHYVLVDPTRESLPYMRQVEEQLNATVLNVAASDESGMARLYLKADGHIGASTLIQESSFPVGDSYEVQCARLDSLVTDFDGPSLCKIDVQGAELRALMGMTGILPRVDALVVEVSTMPENESSPECADIISWLSDHGFSIFDIVDINRRPRNGLLRQIDIAFVPADSVFRKDRRWID